MSLSSLVSSYTIVIQNVLPNGVDPAGRPSLASYSLGTRPLHRKPYARRSRGSGFEITLADTSPSLILR
jgi:hypothetical protein